MMVKQGQRLGKQAVRLLLLVLVLTSGLLGCSQKPTAVQISKALESAERLERRAIAAYNKGDTVSAAKDYQVSLQVYESLAIVDAQAGVQLSLAKIDAEDGRLAKALERVQWVLLSSNEAQGINKQTRLLASGRAAALHLQLHQLKEAQMALAEAEVLCAASCEQAPVLQTLKANWQLASGNAFAAEQSAAEAKLAAKHQIDVANALRIRALARLALNNYSAAAVDAKEALTIDQSTGHASRVIADLDILTTAYLGLGDAVLAQRYREQAGTAKQALRNLTKK